MNTIKSILALFVLTAFMGTTAFAQDNQNQDVDVQKEVETEKGEAEYSYEKEADDDGEVEKDADYYSDVDTEQRDSETDLEHESETKGKSSGLTQEDLDRKAEKAASGQDDVGTQDAQNQQNSQYLGSADNQQQNRTEIEPERLPEEVTESITDGEYASWTISRVYEISPEDGQSEMSKDEQMSEEDYGYTQDQSTQLGQEQGTQGQNDLGQNQEDAVVYEIYFLNPDGNQVETQRFDKEGNAR